MPDRAEYYNSNLQPQSIYSGAISNPYANMMPEIDKRSSLTLSQAARNNLGGPNASNSRLSNHLP